MRIPAPRTAAEAFVATAGALMLLSAAMGYRSGLGYLAFLAAMAAVLTGIGLILWAVRRGGSEPQQPGPRWHAIMWSAVMAEFGLAMMVPGDTVFGAAIVLLAALTAGLGWRFVPRRSGASSPT